MSHSQIHNSISILGKGKSSFGHALFRSLKFVHTLIVLSSFEIGTIFDIHSALSIDLIDPTSNNFFNYALTKRAICGCIFLNFCFIGLSPRVIDK